VQIVNVVATTSICQDLDFDELRKNKEIFHNSDVYGGRVAYFKTQNMQGKVSIFSSGKMISAGTKNEKQAYQELKLAADFLIEKGYSKPVNLDFRTQNLVATVDFERSLSLEKLSEEKKAIYEPEQFPGVILRLNEPYKTSILMFASGKTIITGLKSQEHLEPIVKELQKIIESTE
jgi:transcription initiation factor TFIID TATA-box-binding protein